MPGRSGNTGPSRAPAPRFMAKTTWFVNGVVVNGPRAIAASSISLPFSRIAPPTFSESTSCLKPGVTALPVGRFDDEPRRGELVDAPELNSAATAEDVVDFFLGEHDELVAGSAEDRIQDCASPAGAPENFGTCSRARMAAAR